MSPSELTCHLAGDNSCGRAAAEDFSEGPRCSVSHNARSPVLRTASQDNGSAAQIGGSVRVAEPSTDYAA